MDSRTVGQRRVVGGGDLGISVDSSWVVPTWLPNPTLQHSKNPEGSRPSTQGSIGGMLKESVPWLLWPVFEGNKGSILSCRPGVPKPIPSPSTDIRKWISSVGEFPKGR
jgi:hypothetical protein